MRVGQKVTVMFAAPGTTGHRFLRCYVLRRVSNGWQLYDPVRDYSWGIGFGQAGARVVLA
jgi:hypothetical protein